VCQTSSMRHVSTLVALAALAFTACGTTGGGSSSQPFGVFEEFREDGALRRVRGRWQLRAADTPVQRVDDLLEADRTLAVLPEGIMRGPGELVGRGGNTVRYPLVAAGLPIEGGEVRVHFVEFTAIAVTTRVPRNLAGSNIPRFTMSQAMELVRSRDSTLEVRGAPELRWLAPGMLVGEDTPAELHWRIAADDPVGHLPRVFWIDAESGELTWVEPLEASVVEREVWDCHGAASEQVCTEMDVNQTFTVDGPNSAAGTPSDEAQRAYDYALGACERIERTYFDDSACAPLTTFVDLGTAPGYTAHQEGRLFFGPGALSSLDGKELFEHEVGHALAHHHADFTPALEPGAVGESFADLFAIFGRRPAMDWNVRGFERVLRDIDDPAATSHPSSYSRRLRLDGAILADETNDHGEVHANSVILSHGVWIATVRGVEAGPAMYPGIGFAKMEQIVYTAITEMSGRFTTLRQAADDLLTACMLEAQASQLSSVESLEDHWYITAHDCGILRNAFFEVGLIEDPDSDNDGWGDSQDNCPDDVNPLQQQTGPGRSCLPIPPPEDIPDAGPGLPEGGGERMPFPTAPPSDQLPTCPAMIGFSMAAFPPVTITLDEQTPPSCVDCRSDAGAGYSVACRYSDTGGATYTIQMRWQPYDPALYRVITTAPPAGHMHCGAAARQFDPSAGASGGTASSHTHQAQVITNELPSAGARDEERSVLYFLLDDLEMVAAPCP